MSAQHAYKPQRPQQEPPQIQTKFPHIQMPKAFFYDRNIGLSLLDKAVLEVLMGECWHTPDGYVPMSYAKIAEMTGVAASVLCSTGTDKDRPVKRVREGIITRLERLGWISLQQVMGSHSRMVTAIHVHFTKIRDHIPQKVEKKKTVRQKSIRHANNVTPLFGAEVANANVRMANADFPDARSVANANVRHASTKEGGNTSLIQRNTPSNTYDPQQGLPSNEEKGGGVSLSDKKIVGDHDYLDALVTFLTTREIQSAAPTVPTIVTPVPTLPIARDTISKEVVKEEEPLPPTEQVASGYKKPEPLVIRDVADIPEQWSVEQMLAWFDTLPHTSATAIYCKEKNRASIDQMHKQFPNPRDILLTYGYMKYYDTYWTAMNRTVTISAVATKMREHNGNVERTRIPEAEIFAKLGITGCPVVYSEIDPRNPEWQAYVARNKQRLHDDLVAKQAKEKEQNAHGTY